MILPPQLARLRPPSQRAFSFGATMSDLINRYRATRKAPTLLEKIATASSRDELDGMADQLRRDGRLSAEIISAINYRRAELSR